MGARLDNFPLLKDSQENKIESYDYFRILVHGLNLDKKMNMDTFIIDEVLHNEDVMMVEGEYGCIGLCGLNDELIYVTSCEYDGVNTRLNVKRSQLGTVALNHEKYSYIRSLTDLTDDVIDYEFNAVAFNPLSDFFQPILSSSYITLSVEQMQDWFIGNPNRKYNTATKTILYIYEGEAGQLKLQYTGFSGRFSFDSSSNEIRFKFDDKKILWWDREMDKSLIFKNKSVSEVLSATLDYNINKIKYSTYDYEKGKLKDDSFLSCDVIGTKEVTNYSDFFKLISTLGIRLYFDQYDNLLIFSDLNIKVKKGD